MSQSHASAGAGWQDDDDGVPEVLPGHGADRKKRAKRAKRAKAPSPSVTQAPPLAPVRLEDLKPMLAELVQGEADAGARLVNVDGMRRAVAGLGYDAARSAVGRALSLLAAEPRPLLRCVPHDEDTYTLT